MSTVPFGKYKGRPVEDMLADADYMGWLEAQPWFRERFSHLARRDSDALQRTPDHNRLQALFTNDDYCMAFCRAARPELLEEANEVCREGRSAIFLKCLEDFQYFNKCASEQAEGMPEEGWGDHRDKEISRYKKRAEDCRAFPASIRDSYPQWFLEGRMFEAQNIDVQFTCGLWWWTKESYSLTRTKEFKSLSFHIEIKPVMADDYPVVLRQMLRNRSDYLFLGSYDGQGATYAQLIKMFAASAKRIVLKASVDREAGLASE